MEIKAPIRNNVHSFFKKIIGCQFVYFSFTAKYQFLFTLTKKKQFIANVEGPKIRGRVFIYFQTKWTCFLATS